MQGEEYIARNLVFIDIEKFKFFDRFFKRGYECVRGGECEMILSSFFLKTEVEGVF